jgi:hypothetical protein
VGNDFHKRRSTKLKKILCILPLFKTINALFSLSSLTEPSFLMSTTFTRPLKRELGKNYYSRTNFVDIAALDNYVNYFSQMLIDDNNLMPVELQNFLSGLITPRRRA